MKALIKIIKGFLIGVAAVIPGLSGSVFAVVVGLYEDLLLAVSNLRKNFRSSIRYLLPIVFGAALGVLLSTNLVLWVCETYRQQSYFFFIGLVLGSWPLIWRKMKKIRWKPQYCLLTLAAFAGVLLLSSYTSTLAKAGAEDYVAISQLQGAGDILTVFGAGLFSCSLMSIPGVSGSILLMVIGQYGTVYHSVGQCADLLLFLLQGEWSQAGNAASGVLVALPFLLGAALGFLLVAKLLVSLLKKAEALTYYAVAGLIAGSVVTLFRDGILSDPSFSPAIGLRPFFLFLLLDLLLAGAGIFCTKHMDAPEKSETSTVLSSSRSG